MIARVLMLFFLLLAVPSCMIRVDPARARLAEMTAPANPAQQVSLWPGRPVPTAPSFSTKRGDPPVDQGVYGHCRVYNAGEVKDGIALILSSQRPKPIEQDDEPFELTVVGREGTNKVALSTKNHRLSLSVVRAAHSATPKGLIIYLSSIMMISEEEKSFIQKLQEHGWNVAAITPSIDLFAQDSWPKEWDEAEVDKQASLVAREIDNYLAETAFAAEAVLSYLTKLDRRWVDGSRVVIGASAGALATPSLLKRIGGADAAVYIGGGANIPEIVLTSTLKIYRPTVTISEKGLSRKQRRVRRKAALTQLQTLALNRSRLDPLRLAPIMKQTPTLMMTAESDRIVPAATGELLYDALGRPERWRYPMGHIMLFLSLPYQADRVADWLDQTTRQSR